MSEKNNDNPIQFEDIVEDDLVSRPEPTEQPLTELRKLRLAEGTLVVIAVLFLLSMIAVCLIPTKESNLVFDTCRQTLPPIVTLILGYYFSRK